MKLYSYVFYLHITSNILAVKGKGFEINVNQVVESVDVYIESIKELKKFYINENNDDEVYIFIESLNELAEILKISEIANESLSRSQPTSYFLNNMFIRSNEINMAFNELNVEICADLFSFIAKINETNQMLQIYLKRNKRLGEHNNKTSIRRENIIISILACYEYNIKRIFDIIHNIIFFPRNNRIINDPLYELINDEIENGFEYILEKLLLIKTEPHSIHYSHCSYYDIKELVLSLKCLHYTFFVLFYNYYKKLLEIGRPNIMESFENNDSKMFVDFFLRSIIDERNFDFLKKYGDTLRSFFLVLTKAIL